MFLYVWPAQLQQELISARQQSKRLSQSIFVHKTAPLGASSALAHRKRWGFDTGTLLTANTSPAVSGMRFIKQRERPACKFGALSSRWEVLDLKARRQRVPRSSAVRI